MAAALWQLTAMTYEAEIYVERNKQITGRTGQLGTVTWAIQRDRAQLVDLVDL